MWNFTPTLSPPPPHPTPTPTLADFTCSPPRRIPAHMLIAARVHLGGGRVKFRLTPTTPSPSLTTVV